MQLTELAKDYSGSYDPDIRGLTQDSRRVEHGWLFAALPGSKQDGRKYINDAIHLGAVAVLAPPGTKVEAPVALVEDVNPRHRLALMAAAFYGQQPEVITAVTGTNGKTSTVHFTQQIWSALGIKAASLGTLGVRGPGMVRSGSLTTPDPVSLHAELADLASSGVTHLAMEASSHGLHQSRLDGVRVTAAGFTNLTHDHLDYHQDMEDYFIAKTHLFEEILQAGGVAVLNADIPEFGELAQRVRRRNCRVISYGRSGQGIILKSLTPTPQGQQVSLDVSGQAYDLNIPLVGEFQVMNALCALGLVIAENEARTGEAVRCLGHLTGAPGRLQKVPGSGRGAVYIDYAHTPDALENILKALRPHTGGRLLCIIGCGGDRDPRKRPVMGRIASQLADIAIITDDNPRSEDPAAIRAQMMTEAENAIEIAGRRAAIEWAAGELAEGDVLVIAGKGHEQGQIIGDRVEPFDDFEEAKRAMGLQV